MNKQEVFDTVAKHLLTQNKPAKDNLCCKLKSHDGLMCAVGCLIPEEDYVPYLEDYSFLQEHEVEHFRKDPLGSVLRKTIGRITIEKFELLRHLQDIHDSLSPEEWPNALMDTTNYFKLNRKALK